MRKKEVAAFLALFFGIFGTHRYYLGQQFLGILYSVVFFITLTITIGENEPLIMIPAILAFLDFILLAAMPRPVFDRKYNKDLKEVSTDYSAWSRPDYESSNNQDRYKSPSKAAPISRKKKLEHLKREAIQQYRQGQYRKSINSFEHILERTPGDPIVHFNLACCHSMLRESEPAFFHLQQAVDKGFPDRNKIFDHQALAWLNHLDTMDDFIRDNFHKSTSAPSQEPETPLDLTAIREKEAVAVDTSPDLLEKIEELGRLKERGILTEEEFQMQKRRWLDN